MRSLLLLNSSMEYVSFSTIVLIGYIVWVFIVLRFMKKKFSNTKMFINLSNGESPNISNIAGFCVFIAMVFFIPKYTNAPLNDIELYIYTAISLLMGVKGGNILSYLGSLNDKK